MSDIPAEIETLLCCARGTDCRLREIAQRGLDWESLLGVAANHQIKPLVYRSLNRACPEAVPVGILRRMREHDCDNARRSLFLTGKLIHLLELFRAQGIAAIALKGPVLAQTLYCDLTRREFLDLDLLVRKHDLAEATQLLQRQGYSLCSELAWAPYETVVRMNCELTYVHPNGAHVDLHWEVAPSDYPFRFDTDILWSSLQSVSICGRDVPILSPENQLLFLCIHGAKHLWASLKWICDVGKLLETSVGIDWTRTLNLARKFGCEHVVLLGVLLAHDLLEAPLPPDVLGQAQADQVIGPLAAQVQQRLFESPSGPKSLELVIFNAKMTGSYWRKVRHFAALLRAPTEADARLLRLPPKLFFLYYPFRFFRMVAKYACKLG